MAPTTGIRTKSLTVPKKKHKVLVSLNSTLKSRKMTRRMMRRI